MSGIEIREILIVLSGLCILLLVDFRQGPLLVHVGAGCVVRVVDAIGLLLALSGMAAFARRAWQWFWEERFEQPLGGEAFPASSSALSLADDRVLPEGNLFADGHPDFVVEPSRIEEESEEKEEKEISMACREVRSWLTVSRDEWAPGHFIWPLMEREELSVRVEAVPEGGGFDPHSHSHSHQFVFVLEGTALVEVEGETIQLTMHEGVELAPGEEHRVENAGEGSLLYLIISAPRAAPALERE